MADPHRPRRRWLRRVLIAVPVLLVLLGVLVAFAPIILSQGAARAIIADILDGEMNAAVSIDTATLSWDGPQTITGVSLLADDGESRIDADIVIDGTLIDLLTGPSSVDALIEGRVETMMRQDGSLALLDMLAGGDQTSGGGPGSSGGTTTPPTFPDMQIAFRNVELIVADEVSNRSLEFALVQGDIDVKGGKLLVEVRGSNGPSSDSMSFSMDLTAHDLLGPRGVQYAGAAVDLNVRLSNVPLVQSEVDGTIKALGVDVTTDDLTKRLIIDGDALVTMADVGDCRIEVNVSHDEAFDRAGDVHFDPLKLVGTIKGSVPASIVQPWLADTPIDVARDLGARLDVNAVLGGPEGDRTEDVVSLVEISGESVTLFGTGKVDDLGMLHVASATLDARIDPALAADLDLPRFDEPAAIRVIVERLLLPPAGGDPSLRRGEGRLQVVEPIKLVGEEGQALALVNSMDVGVAMTPGFRDARIDGVATVDGAAITLTGVVSDVLDENAGRRVDLVAAGVPTSLADRLGAFDGLLVDGLGSTLDLELSSAAPLEDGDQLRLRMTAASATLNGDFVAAGKTLVAADDRQLVGSIDLGAGLGRRLMAGIHPLFQDIQSTSQPLQVVVTNLTLPTDGDVSALDADIEMTLGDVQISSGSLLFTIMALFEQTNAATVPGYVEPVRATIRGGVVTYERFAMRLDKQELVYTGSVDLNTRKIALRTEYPLSGLARSFSELRGYTEGISVPIVTRGTFGDYETTIDPEYKLEEDVLREGLKGLLDDLLGDGGR